MKIHYICSYIDDELFGEYCAALSGRAKITYIKQTLLNSGNEVSLFSPVKCSSRKFTVKKKKVLCISRSEQHFYPFSFGGDNALVKVISYAMIYLQLAIYLIAKVKKEDAILLYHAIPDTKIALLVNKILKRRIFLEIEELYSARTFQGSKIEEEKNIVREGFNGYVVVNSIIASKCGITKPSVVCEGQYGMLSKHPKKSIDEKGIVNVVYSGIFRDNDDVFVAAEAARYLNKEYKLHICGYGEDIAVQHLKEKIREINNTDGCKIEFYGSLEQSAYEELMDKCSIGLCPRLLKDDLSDYEFPSKILAYLSRNILVVCSPLSCVKNSKLSETIVFSETNEPKHFAEAIMRYPIDVDIDNSRLLAKQDERFVKELGNLFIL